MGLTHIKCELCSSGQIDPHQVRDEITCLKDRSDIDSSVQLQLVGVQFKPTCFDSTQLICYPSVVLGSFHMEGV